MGDEESDRAGSMHPMLEVKRVTLDDGLHASLILENGRICKLVSPSGEVAVLKWEGEQDSPRPAPASVSRLHLTRVSPRTRPAGAPDGFVAARHFWASKSIGGPQHHITGLGNRRGSSRGSSEPSVNGGRAPMNSSGSYSSSSSSSSSSDSSGAAPALPERHCSSTPEAAFEESKDAPDAQGHSDTRHGDTRTALQLDVLMGAEDSSPFRADSAAEHLHSRAPPATASDEVDLHPWPEVAISAGVGGAELHMQQDAAETQSSVTLAEPDEAQNAAWRQRGDCNRYKQTAELSTCSDERSMASQPVGCEPEEASQQGADEDNDLVEEDDRLEELMGAVPTINLRELRTQVASLPEILSRAERTAELCARGSGPGGLPRNSTNPQKLTDGSIHSWVVQSRATAILIQRDQHIGRHPHSFCNGAWQTRRGPISEGEAEGSEAGQPGSAVGSADSVLPAPHQRLTARRSLADVRASIGIAPEQDAYAAGRSVDPKAPKRAKEQQPAHKQEAKTSQEKQAEMAKPKAIGMLQEAKAKELPGPARSGSSVWGKLASVFPGRRVRPESAGARAHSTTSGAALPPSLPKVQHRSMTERLFGSHQRKPKGITLPEWPQKPSGLSTAALQPAAKLGIDCNTQHATATAMQQPATSGARSAPPTHRAQPEKSTRKVRRHQSKASVNRTGMAGRWRMEPNETALQGGQQVEDLLDLPLLQRLAQQRAQEIQIVETDDTFEFIQTIRLNGTAKIVRCTKYPKSGKMVETQRADSREGALRSQLNISPEGHCHMRSLQGEPYAAVFHRRIKMSSGGHRLKIEQKFQLLAPGVMPVKYHSIWHRIEDSNSGEALVRCPKEPLLAM